MNLCFTQRADSEWHNAVAAALLNPAECIFGECHLSCHWYYGQQIFARADS